MEPQSKQEWLYSYPQSTPQNKISHKRQRILLNGNKAIHPDDKTLVNVPTSNVSIPISLKILDIKA
jgi:hypothetical protein